MAAPGPRGCHFFRSENSGHIPKNAINISAGFEILGRLS